MKYELERDACYVLPIVGFAFDASNIQTGSTKICPFCI